MSRLAGLRASPPPAPPRAPSPRSHPRSPLACPSFDLATESGILGGEGGTRGSHSPLGTVTRASSPPRCSWCHGAAGRAAREAGGQGLVDWGGSLPPTAGHVRCPKPLGRPVCPGSLSPARRLPVTARREQTRAQARRLSPRVTDTQRFSRAHVSRAIGGGGEYGDLSSHTLGGCYSVYRPSVVRSLDFVRETRNVDSSNAKPSEVMFLTKQHYTIAYVGII